MGKGKASNVTALPVRLRTHSSCLLMAAPLRVTLCEMQDYVHRLLSIVYHPLSIFYRPLSIVYHPSPISLMRLQPVLPHPALYQQLHL